MEDFERRWRPVIGSGIPEGTEVDEVSGDVRWGNDGSAGDREPRNPKLTPAAGAAALELAEVTQD